MASKLEIQQRRRRIQDLENQGVASPTDIAQRLGVSLRTVQTDIATLDLAYQTLEEAALFRLRQRRVQVARADDRYAELKAAWERSKADKKKRRAKDAETKDKRSSARTETQSEQGRLGDPAYMRLMLDNDKHVADLLGLYPAARTELSGPGGRALPVQVIEVVRGTNDGHGTDGDNAGRAPEIPLPPRPVTGVGQ